MSPLFSPGPQFWGYGIAVAMLGDQGQSGQGVPQQLDKTGVRWVKSEVTSFYDISKLVHNTGTPGFPLFLVPIVKGENAIFTLF